MGRQPFVFSCNTTNGSASRLPRACRYTFAAMPFSSNVFANSFARSMEANLSTFMVLSNHDMGTGLMYGLGRGKANPGARGEGRTGGKAQIVPRLRPYPVRRSSYG